MALKYCPFCGESNEIKAVTKFKKMARLDGTYDHLTLAYISCRHCGARGSTMIEETRDVAIERAAHEWNEARRVGWWHRNVTCRWHQLQYDIHCIRSDGYDYDLRAYWKDLWR
jgi:sarcosine oxidase delta subunit